MTASASPGSIITFYSYKGGTGRSMALANVGCLLALRQAEAAGRGVLLVDWDLEAPGLHRFFRNRFRRALGAATDPVEALAQRPGLIDLFWRLEELIPAGQIELSSSAEAKLRAQLNLREFVLDTDIDCLHVLKAGRFGDDYSQRATTFKWEELYRRAPWVIPWFASWLAESFEHVLIDSRTGVTDTSGICTMLLPEKLVVVFTPNFQSTEGALDQIKAATSYRRRSDDLRPLIVYPLPSRIESTLPKLRDRWRRDPGIGYQPRFEILLKDVYGLPACDLTSYFDANQIAQVPEYAYGEEIAVLEERDADKFSLTSSYRAFTGQLLSPAQPWEKPGEAESRMAVQDLLRRAYSLWARSAPDEAEHTLSALTRLVQVAAGPEVGSDGARRVRIDDVETVAAPAVKRLIEAGIVRETLVGQGHDPFLELVDPALVTAWPPLKERVEADREFLIWRQRLDDAISQWRAAKRGNDLLLRASLLARAQELAQTRSASLNDAERGFIKESSLEMEREREEEKRRERELSAQAAAAEAKNRARGPGAPALSIGAFFRRHSEASARALALAILLVFGEVLVWIASGPEHQRSSDVARFISAGLFVLAAGYLALIYDSRRRQRAYARRAYKMLSLEQWRKAENLFRKAASEDGELKAWARAGQGVSLAKLGRHEEAQGAFALALRLDPAMEWIREARDFYAKRAGSQ